MAISRCALRFPRSRVANTLESCWQHLNPIGLTKLSATGFRAMWSINGYWSSDCKERNEVQPKLKRGLSASTAAFSAKGTFCQTVASSASFVSSGLAIHQKCPHSEDRLCPQDMQTRGKVAGSHRCKANER